MKKKRGLVISWFYPPGNSSEGLVTYKLLKNSEFEYDVFTRKTHDASIWDRQTDESDLVADNVTVYQATTNDECEWAQEAVDFFEKNADKYDFVMSRILSAEAHVAAAKIKEKYPQILWIASFGDPLVNSPYIPSIQQTENPFFLKRYLFREQPSLPKLLKLTASPTRQARKLVWEKDRIETMRFAENCEKINRETFAKADVLVFNNNYQVKRAFVDEYAKYRDKGIIINHSYDLSMYPKEATKREDKRLHFVYVGHLDAMRNAKALLEAVGELKSHDPDLSNKVQFDFYGHIDDSDKVAIVDNKVADIVNLYGDVSYLDSLKKMKNADWLILIDTNLTTQLDEYIYFPAKLVDYFGAKKNILAITQMRGTSADAIREVKAGQVVAHSADNIALYLAKAIYQNYAPAKYDKAEWKKYDAREVAAKFDKIVLEKLGGKV